MTFKFFLIFSFLRKYPPNFFYWSSLNSQYQIWLKKNYLSKEILGKQIKEVETLKLKSQITLILPAWEKINAHLKEAVKSVLDQTYPFFALKVLANSQTEEKVKKILEDCLSKKLEIVLSGEKSLVPAINHLLGEEKSDYLILLNQDNWLWPNALLEVAKKINKKPETDLIYTDEDKIDIFGRHFEPFFKPDWSPDLILSVMYVGDFLVWKHSLIENIGGLREESEKVMMWDLVLRAAESGVQIEHIPTILCSKRGEGKRAAGFILPKEPVILEVQKKILEDALKRRGILGEVENGPFPTSWRIKYEVLGSPLVSIIISTKDRAALLEKCVNGILKNDYPNFELLIVDNRSIEVETFAYFEKLKKYPKIRILKYDKLFNIAEIYNFAVKQARGEYIVFMGNDTEPMTNDWLRRMLGYGQRKDVGAVGAKLLYHDGTIQHAGVVLGYGRFPDKSDHVAGHCFSHFPDIFGYFGFIQLARNCSAVTGAVILTKKNFYQEVKGFDGQNLKMLFNDVDYCLKLRVKGYYIIYAPDCVLYHRERASLGKVGVDFKINPDEVKYMRDKWAFLEDNDPFYNPNLSLQKTDYSLRI